MMWTVVFNSFSHPCDVTDVAINVLSDVTLVVGVVIFVDIEIIVVTTATITLEFAVTAL